MTAGRVYPAPVKAAIRAGADLHVRLYRLTDGKVGSAGGRVLLLTTTGRKTGERRTTPLYHLADGDDLVVVASFGGAAKHPAWCLNLEANPEAVAEVGGRKIQVRAEEAGPEEKERLWPLLVEMYPGYESYRRRTDREIRW